MTEMHGFLYFCVNIALFVLSVSLVIVVIRIYLGPTLPDRILALDMLVTVGIAFIGAVGIKTRFYLYVDIAIALGLVGFLATVAFARFVLTKASEVEDPPALSDPDNGGDNLGEAVDDRA